MATTVLGHMKEAKVGQPAAHLKNAIDYILDVKNNGQKTEGGKWIGGNSGISVNEIFQTMMDTKMDWEKLSGRQGYHYVISFSPDEKVDEKKAYEVISDFCKQYLGDRFDYVFAIHNDTKHMHGHVVFNSVGRIDGYKYRYVKGDWEKKIQPITDAICKKYGLKELVYEDKRVGKSYAEHLAIKKGKQTGKKIIQGDIDYAIRKSGSWEEFLKRMEEFQYKLRFGSSELKGEYITFHSPGSKKGRRSYNLGHGYSVADIKQRIATKDYRFMYSQIPKLKKVRINSNVRQSNLTRYQVRRIQRLHRAKCYRLLNPYAVNHTQVRKDLLRIHKISEDCKYMLRNNLRSEQDLIVRKNFLQLQERMIKGERNTLYANEPDDQEQRVSLEYQKLENELANGHLSDEEFEKVLERMEELEAQYPISLLENKVDSSKKEFSNEIAAVRKEIRIINRILREQKEVCPEMNLIVKDVSINRGIKKLDKGREEKAIAK